MSGINRILAQFSLVCALIHEIHFLEVFKRLSTTVQQSGSFSQPIQFVEASWFYHLCCSEECNSKCQQLLHESLIWCQKVAGHMPQACLFSNILDLTPDVDYKSFTCYSHRLQACQAAELAHSSMCATHCRLCPVNKPNVAFDVSGLPCPDMSTAGKRLRRAGDTASVYMTHGKHACKNRTPLLLIECTKDGSN